MSLHAFTPPGVKRSANGIRIKMKIVQAEMNSLNVKRYEASILSIDRNTRISAG
jgi:hypothetical protein